MPGEELCHQQHQTVSGWQGMGVAGCGGSGACPSREGAHWWGVTRAGLGCGPGGNQGAVTPDASVALTNGLRLMVTGLNPKLAESQLLSANLFVFLKCGLF